MAIIQSNNGSEAMAAINAALLDAGSEVTVGNESGSSVATKLNGVFDDSIVTSSQSGSQFAQAVEDGFEAMGGGDTPTPEPTDDHIKLRFLHISDLHGRHDALSRCYEMLYEDEDISHLIISGDMTPYDTPANYPEEALAILEDIKALGDRLLLVTGNHDAYDNPHSNLSGVSDYFGTSGAGKKVNEKAWLKAMMGRHEVVDGNDEFVSNVNFGTDANKGGYWYKDISVGNNTVRVIGIDDYEHDGKPTYTNPDTGVTAGAAYVQYSQGQVDWLIDTLYNTPSGYHILMVSHEPPCKEVGEHVKALSMCPQSQEQALGSNLFVSELHSSFHERAGEINVNLLPTIMYAYLHQQNLDTTYTNNGNNGETILVKNQESKGFYGHEPANLLGWVFGHIHRDVVQYMPFIQDGFNDQLLLGIAAADSQTMYSSGDDLCYHNNNTGTGNVSRRYANGDEGSPVEPSWRINEIIIDFTDRIIKVCRHGNMTTAVTVTKTGNGHGSQDQWTRPYGGRVRNEITFPFVKDVV